MAKYIKNFVTGHGVTYERNKRNVQAFEKAAQLWGEIWSGLKDELDGDSIVLLCGAKNNGKSSLMRYLINNYNHPMHARKSSKSNSSRNSDENDIEMIDDCNLIEDGTKLDRDRYAYLIDYDPGQCECTSVGMISAHIIRASAPPLQSPTYLNLGQHESIVMSSVGGINMSVNPSMFIDNGRFIYNKVLEHQASQTVKRPIFINTMGFIRNVGLAMLMDIIKICRPTNLLVLNVEADPMRTIYADLTPHAIDNTRASFYYESNKESHKKLSYKCDIYNLQFMFIDSSSVANKNRTALQLAYMASIPEALYKPIMQLSTKSLSLSQVSIYCVSSYPLKEGIVIELLHHSWIHLVKLRKPLLYQQQHQYDATITALASSAPVNDGGQTTGAQSDSYCTIIDNVRENTLFGCGIVADIDFERGLLAIITPIDQATLDTQVDCVIKPLSIQVPREMMG